MDYTQNKALIDLREVELEALDLELERFGTLLVPHTRPFTPHMHFVVEITETHTKAEHRVGILIFD